MPKYQQLTTALIRETSNEVAQSQFPLQPVRPMHPLELLYRRTLICALELILQEPKYRKELSTTEQSEANKLKTYLSQSKDTFDNVLIELANTLRNRQRGCWIFDLGQSNGFFYEGLLGVMRQLKENLETINSPQPSPAETPKMNPTAMGNASYLLLQQTLKTKNKLSSVPPTPDESDNESDAGLHEFINKNKVRDANSINTCAAIPLLTEEVKNRVQPS